MVSSSLLYTGNPSNQNDLSGPWVGEPAVAVVAVRPATEAHWDSAWEGTPHATFFQSTTWARVWETYSGGASCLQAQQIRFNDGVEVVLPTTYERRLRGLLGRRVASPAATFGGWLSSSALSAEHQRLALRALLHGNGSSLVWRLSPYDRGGLEAARRLGLSCRADRTHALQLAPGPAAILKNLKNGYRSDIVRARKKGRIQVVEATTSDEWRAYFRVYQETLTRWGLEQKAGYRWPLFEALQAQRSPRIKLWLALYDGAVVSGELCFYGHRHAVSWHAATLKSYLKTNVAKVQLMAVIEDACRRGFDWFDFNPSAGLAGVEAFKEGFNTTPLPAPIVYVDNAPKRLARRVAGALGVGSARLKLTPIDELLAALPPPQGAAAPCPLLRAGP